MARVASLEAGAAGQKEGLRRRIDKGEQLVRELERRVNDVERIIENETEEECPLGLSEGADAAASVAAEAWSPELYLQNFRKSLCVGMPVHTWRASHLATT